VKQADALAQSAKGGEDERDSAWDEPEASADDESASQAQYMPPRRVVIERTNVNKVNCSFVQ